MRLAYTCHPHLPKLAWLALVERGQETISVHHGPCVEVQRGFFIEGVWNGDFAMGAFDNTECIFGTGAVLRGKRIVFVPPAATTDSLYYAEVSGGMAIANSLSLLLASIRDELDPHFPHYPRYNESILNGINQYEKTLKTKKGTVNRLVFRNLEVTSQSLREFDKPPPPSFAAYTDYVAYLRENYRLLVHNLRSPHRRSRVDIFSTQSRGYDTTAVNAIAAEYGIDKVFTCPKGKSPVALAPRDTATQEDDDGTEICTALGLQSIHIDRKAYERGFADEQWYWASQHGNQDANLLEINGHVQDVALLLTGTLGEIWYTEQWYAARNGNLIDADLRRADVSGHGLAEVRLKVGLIHLPLPFLGAQRRAEIFRISNSAEMAPWRLGRPYDRPIPRRIAEERGVPRHLFGQVKRASVVLFPNPCLPYGEVLRAEFLDYLVCTGTIRWWQTKVWPLIHEVNTVLAFRSERRYRWAYYLERAIARLRGQGFVLSPLWKRLDGAIFCFCVNRCVREDAQALAAAGRGIPGSQLCFDASLPAFPKEL